MTGSQPAPHTHMYTPCRSNTNLHTDVCTHTQTHTHTHGHTRKHKLIQYSDCNLISVDRKTDNGLVTKNTTHKWCPEHLAVKGILLKHAHSFPPPPVGKPPATGPAVAPRGRSARCSNSSTFTQVKSPCRLMFAIRTSKTDTLSTAMLSIKGPLGPSKPDHRPCNKAGPLHSSYSV